MSAVRRAGLGLLMLSLLPLAAWAKLDATLDRVTVGDGESIQLLLQRDSRGGEPDLSPLQADFDIVGRSSGSSISIVDGHIATSTQYQVTLIPKRVGTLQIPPIRWGDDVSQALTVEVSDQASAAQSDPGSAAAHVFLTQRLETPSPYLQSASLLSVQLHTDRPLYEASLTPPQGEDLLIEPIGDDKTSFEFREGRRFQVIERQYVVIPQRSGTLQLDAPVLDALVEDQGRGADTNDMFERFFGHAGMPSMRRTTKPMRLRGDAVSFEVQPRPNGWTDPYWLPSSGLSLDGRWSDPGAGAAAGEPVTLHLHAEAAGLSTSLLPDLASLLALPDGLRAYPEPAQRKDVVRGDQIVATVDQDITLIASRAGQYRVPALRLPWWNVDRQQRAEAVVPEHSLEFAAAAVAAGAGPAPSPQTAPDLATPDTAAPPPSADATTSPAPASRGILMGVVLGGLGTALAIGLGYFAVRRLRRSRFKQPRVEPAQARFKTACAQRDAVEARRWLLIWSRQCGGPDKSLKAVADHLGDPRVAAELARLDAACFGMADFDGAPLAALLGRWPKVGVRRSRETAPLMRDLYS